MSETLAYNAFMFLSGLIFGACLTRGWYKRLGNRVSTCENQLEINSVGNCDFSDTDFRDKKLVLVVRNDLKMGKGKVAAQCSHAAVMAHESSRKTDPKTLNAWKKTGQPKIVVKVDSEDELIELAIKAKTHKIQASIVHDAGRTQVPARTKTVLALGPGPTDVIDQLTGHLKLY